MQLLLESTLFGSAFFLIAYQVYTCIWILNPSHVLELDYGRN